MSNCMCHRKKVHHSLFGRQERQFADSGYTSNCFSSDGVSKTRERGRPFVKFTQSGRRQEVDNSLQQVPDGANEYGVHRVVRVQTSKHPSGYRKYSILTIDKNCRTRNQGVNPTTSERGSCGSAFRAPRNTQLALQVYVIFSCGVGSAWSKNGSTNPRAATNSARSLALTSKKFVPFLCVHFHSRQHREQVPCASLFTADACNMYGKNVIETHVNSVCVDIYVALTLRHVRCT